jgi:hypothetical protein
MTQNKLFKALNTKFYIGVLAIITSFMALYSIYFVGFFMGFILLPVGLYSVAISEQNIWLKILVFGLSIVFIYWRYFN